MPPLEPKTLAIWFPDWPVQHARLEDKCLRAKAIAFTDAGVRSEVVVACSQEARSLGVTPGMRTADAQSLVVPGRLTTLAHDPIGDRRRLTHVGEACQRFSPSVALEEAGCPEALLLDIRGVAVLWGDSEAAGEFHLIRAIEAWLRNQRLRGVLAMASTAPLALAMARHRQWIPQHLLGHTHAASSEPDVREHLPVEALHLDEATRDKLYRLGIDTVGRLLELPRSALPARFGKTLTEEIDRLLGRTPSPLEPIVCEPPLEAAWPFECAVRSGNVLQETLSRMLERIAIRLQQQGRGALRVLIRYELDIDPPECLPITLRVFRPITSAKELIELAQLQTAGLRFSASVKGVHALVGSTAPVDRRQRTLFDDEGRDDHHETAKLINRLANRVGGERVSRVEKRQTADSRRSFILLAATDTPARRFNLTPLQASRVLRLPLAMRRNEGRGIVVHMDDQGAPLVVAGRRVVRCWGPERLETGWWRGRGIRRDAYWVELEDGERLWLEHQLRRRSWRIAGEFA